MHNELQNVCQSTPHIAVECLHIVEVLGSDLDRLQVTLAEGFRCFLYAIAAIATYPNVGYDHFHILSFLLVKQCVI